MNTFCVYIYIYLIHRKDRKQRIDINVETKRRREVRKNIEKKYRKKSTVVTWMEIEKTKWKRCKRENEEKKLRKRKRRENRRNIKNTKISLRQIYTISIYTFLKKKKILLTNLFFVSFLFIFILNYLFPVSREKKKE